MVLKHRRPLPTPEEAMHDLLEEETTASLTNELGDASMGAALFCPHGGYCGRGCGGRSVHSGHSGNSGTGDSHKSKCTHCKIDSHTTDACWKRKHAQEGGNNRNDERICFQWALPGHIKVDCISYQHIQEWWRGKKASATTALATTEDCDPFWLTSCVLTATAAAAPNFSMFNQLSLHIVIQLVDNNSVATTHYSFIDIIQRITPTIFPIFWFHLLGPRFRGLTQLRGSLRLGSIISSHPLPTLLEPQLLFRTNSYWNAVRGVAECWWALCLQAPLVHYNASRLIPEVQRRGKFGPRSNALQDHRLHKIQRCCGGYAIPNSKGWKPHKKLSSKEQQMHTCHVSMEAMRSTCSDYQKLKNMLKDRYRRWASPRTR